MMFESPNTTVHFQLAVILHQEHGDKEVQLRSARCCVLGELESEFDLGIFGSVSFQENICGAAEQPWAIDSNAETRVQESRRVVGLSQIGQELSIRRLASSSGISLWSR